MPAIGLRDESGDQRLATLAARWSLTHDPRHPLMLVQTPGRLELRWQQQEKSGAVFVDFLGGRLAFRGKFGGGRREALAKAVGVKGDQLPGVLDATAGFGGDAFILACIGCRVQMIERNPIVAALLEDGLQRGYQDAQIGGWLRERLTLRHAASEVALSTIGAPIDVVYLDPMFPHRRKAARVKQPMQMLQTLIGEDADAACLLHPARALAGKRVVVKRPDSAPPLANLPAHGAVHTKNHRFDIYLPLN